MRWPARRLQELQLLIHGVARAPMLQCDRSQTFFVPRIYREPFAQNELYSRKSPAERGQTRDTGDGALHVRHSAVPAGVSAGHMKKPDLLRMRPVEYTDRFGGRLQ
jgi:hypothetical protein